MTKKTKRVFLFDKQTSGIENLLAKVVSGAYLILIAWWVK